MNKRMLMIAAAVVISLLVISVLKDIVIEVAVERGVELVAGLKLRIDRLHVGVLQPVVSIKGLTIYNPSQFKDKVMVKMPEIYVNYDLGAILHKDIHMRKIKIHLNEFVVVKNEKGELNLNSLKVVQSQKAGAATKKKESGAMPKMRIDDLHLKIDKALYKDYSGGGAPSIKEFNINIDQRYTNINDAYTLVSLIVVQSLARTNISNMAGFDMNGVKSMAQSAAAQTIEKTQAAMGKAGEVAKGVGEAFKGIGIGK